MFCREPLKYFAGGPGPLLAPLPSVSAHPHPRTDRRKGKQEETGLKRETETETENRKKIEEKNRGEHINRGLFTHTHKKKTNREGELALSNQHICAIVFVI